jgi:hypothetical protein
MYDGDENPAARRRSLKLAMLVLAGLVVGSVCVVAGAWWFADRDDEQAAPTTDEPVVPEEPVVDGLALRTTDEGIELRVSPPGDEAPFFGPNISDLPKCTLTGAVNVSAVSSASIGELQLPLSEEVDDVGAGVASTFGAVVGDPIYVVALQVPEEVVRVRLTNGAAFRSDEVEPTDGVAVLAVRGELGESRDVLPAIDTSQVRIDLFGAAGPVASRTAIEMSGPLAWTDPECRGELEAAPLPSPEAPRPELPPAGEQPANAAAIEADIQRMMSELFAAPLEKEREYFDLLDDASGLDVVIPNSIESGFAVVLEDALTESEVVVTDLVFLSPIEAMFLYDIATPHRDEESRLGRARLSDGVWRITRGTFCAELERLEGWCPP